MYELLQNIANLWSGVANFFIFVKNGIVTVFQVVFALRAAIMSYLSTVPSWIAALILLAVVVSIALCVMLSR